MNKAGQEDHQGTAIHPVIVFDGICNLCNSLVDFVIRHDAAGRFRFAAAQTEAGERILRKAGVNRREIESVMLVDDGNVSVKSDAVLGIAAGLGGAWKILIPLAIIPRRLRDFLYDFVAGRRYHWFGTRNFCPIPDEDIRRRFL